MRIAYRMGIIVLISILIVESNYGQSIIRSSLGCLGSTVTDNELILRQTVGQSSNTYVFNSGSMMLRQGFQQPLGCLRDPFPMNISEFTIFPNPTSGATKICFKQEIKQATFTLLNLSGRPILEFEERSFYYKWLDLKNFTPGVYLLTVKYDNQIGSSKLVITK